MGTSIGLSLPTKCSMGMRVRHPNTGLFETMAIGGFQYGRMACPHDKRLMGWEHTMHTPTRSRDMERSGHRPTCRALRVEFDCLIAKDGFYAPYKATRQRITSTTSTPQWISRPRLRRLPLGLPHGLPFAICAPLFILIPSSFLHYHTQNNSCNTLQRQAFAQLHPIRRLLHLEPCTLQIHSHALCPRQPSSTSKVQHPFFSYVQRGLAKQNLHQQHFITKWPRVP